MRPTLIVNPATDGVFARFAEVLVDDGACTIRELERRLRTIYPAAVVHARELSGERGLVWYVYRAGYWIDSRRIPVNRGGHYGNVGSQTGPPR
jgi:hypothetical protein